MSNTLWISASSTYNYCMKDPLIDWFKYNTSSGSSKGSNITHDSFTQYLMEQGNEFERKVLKMMIKKFGELRIAKINANHDKSVPLYENITFINDTIAAMKKGVPFIYNGLLINNDDKTYGVPDLLVRSDWLNLLTLDDYINGTNKNHSCNFNSKYHYVVVDIKFTNLALRADGIHLLNAASFPAYKAQLYIYNQALGKLQGYTPQCVYILGRKWKYTSKGQDYAGTSCFEKLGVIDYSLVDREYKEITKNAVEWLRRCRSPEAALWNVSKYPLTCPELYPNMNNAHDSLWHHEKTKIAEDNKELTCLWMVGVKNRDFAHKQNIYSWNDPNCTAKSLNVNGPKISIVLDKIIEINKQDVDLIRPTIITNNMYGWKDLDSSVFEFFLDFESTNGSMTSIHHIPNADVSNLIFMIGLGYIDKYTGKWVYVHFTVNTLTESEELRICTELVEHIKMLCEEFSGNDDSEVIPKCIHWSNAEDTLWTNIIEKYNNDTLNISGTWQWVDLLKVFREEPIVIKDCMGFGLKEVAKTMHKHGFIRSTWPSSECSNGSMAMVLARQAHEKAKSKGVSMHKISVIREIIKYNEVDVKVLQEILEYIRENMTAVSIAKNSLGSSAIPLENSTSSKESTPTIGKRRATYESTNTILKRTTTLRDVVLRRDRDM